MSIGSIPYSVLPTIGSALSVSSGARVSLPVTPSSYIYSHFRHVSGVPAPEGVQGISVSQLKILDSMINEIVRLNKQVKPAFNIVTEDPGKQFNLIIEHLQKQIRQGGAANASVPYPASGPDLGTLFSITA